MKIIHERCDPKAAEDRSLPYTSYLVEYKIEGQTAYDIAMGDSQVILFDHYYDKYRKDFVGFKQTEGRLRPNLWNATQPTPPNPRKKRKRSSTTDTE
tara:strand:- start:1986 stop:2276 length:291 start_codon:yes stop_codon:yes gene_type:complete